VGRSEFFLGRVVPLSECVASVRCDTRDKSLEVGARHERITQDDGVSGFQP